MLLKISIDILKDGLIIYCLAIPKFIWLTLMIEFLDFSTILLR